MRFRKHPAALRGIVLDCNRYGVKKLSPGLRDYSFDLTVVDGFFFHFREFTLFSISLLGVRASTFAYAEIFESVYLLREEFLIYSVER